MCWASIKRGFFTVYCLPSLVCTLTLRNCLPKSKFSNTILSPKVVTGCWCIWYEVCCTLPSKRGWCMLICRVSPKWYSFFLGEISILKASCGVVVALCLQEESPNRRAASSKSWRVGVIIFISFFEICK